jgi:UDP-N-acetylmuramate--alanine ligase
MIMNDWQNASIHLIGIGGTGLSAIARVLVESGCRVSGSDRQLSPLAQALQQAGVRVQVGHQAENVHGADMVIRSSAIPDSNPEVVEARRLGIPVLKRADFLGELMSGQVGIAIAGAHGKTTTTAMTAWMLSALGKDPSYIIGGMAKNLGANAHAGRSQYFVIEADEYDRMFHGLKPTLAVITNIEHDHPDCYPTAEDFYQAFTIFAGRVVPGGRLFLCSDDPGAARLGQELAGQTLPYTVFAYGLSPEADYRAVEIATNAAGGLTCQVLVRGQRKGLLSLQVPGEHNLRNALAVVAVGDAFGLPFDGMAAALAEYSGTGRRFDVRGKAAGVTVIDDYGHHPTEIRTTLAAARQRFPGQRLWAVWQPHTYSRTQALFNEFASAFGAADCVVVTEIYASRETPPPGGYSAAAVAAAMAQPNVFFAPTLDDAAELLLSQVQMGDVLITFSAGDADQISIKVFQALTERKQVNV